MEFLHTAPIISKPGNRDGGEAALLVLAAQAHRLARPWPLVLDLQATREVRLGRGEPDQVHRLDGERLDVRLADPCLSSRHARFLSLHVDDALRVLLEDQGSTNGCRINGQRVRQQELAHGDIVEMGQCFWVVYRRTLEGWPDLVEDINRAGPPGPGSSLSLDWLAEKRQVGRVATSAIPLLLLGESGTGKEVLAAEIHRLSGRPGRFVALNCAAIPEGLVESTLFGHRKGAFTGAVADQRGVVEEAERGTLLLDEIGDMPPAMQAKLLRLLQEESFTRVGEASVRRADLRVLAATHRDLRRMVQEGAFRGDLFARLNGLTVTLPPLRRRKEDLGLLVAQFLTRTAPGASPPRAISLRALRALFAYDWPFNIRELKRTVETALALRGERPELDLCDLPEEVRHAGESMGESPTESGARTGPLDAHRGQPGTTARIRREPLDGDALRERLESALRQHEGNISAVARDLETTRMQIHRWMKRLGIDPGAYRS